jgi:tetratricopeptide (TPR) repeat protein
MEQFNMEKLTVKYSLHANAHAPQPIRIKTPGWGGTSEKMQDGSDGQPWHCLPFVEASTYGLELIYQFETECHVVHDNGTLRFEWDFAREPGGVATGGEFIAFAPRRASRYYLFNTRLDVQAPPGHVIRTEPHPRFFTDHTGTVPLSMIGHLQTEWYPRMLFVVFKSPPPGQRHIFRKGEPYAQILFVPQRLAYETAEMTMAENAIRRQLEQDTEFARFEISENNWQNADGSQMDNHYKILARTFAQSGMAGVEQVVRQANEHRQQALPLEKPISECLEEGLELLNSRKRRQAMIVYSHVLEREPNNPDALSHMGICLACLGNVTKGLDMMAQAVALDPGKPKYHSNLGEVLRLLGRPQEAETAFRQSLELNPHDPGIVSVLGLTLAQQGRFAEGLLACQQAAAMGPQLPAVHFRLGLVLAQQGQIIAARAAFEAALAIDPNYADAHRALQETQMPAS